MSAIFAHVTRDVIDVDSLVVIETDPLCPIPSRDQMDDQPNKISLVFGHHECQLHSSASFHFWLISHLCVLVSGEDLDHVRACKLGQ